MCPTATERNRTLGAQNIFCSDPAELGRIELSLYGNLVPNTVDTFLKAIDSGAYNGTIVDKVFKGRYMVVGKSGSKKFGEVQQEDIVEERNNDLTSPKAFLLKHVEPGTLSLSLSEVEDESEPSVFGKVIPNRKKDSLQFTITTGPGPAPMLDDESIIFGKVTKGLEVVQAIANVPTFEPSDQLITYNKFASALGDGRAKTARNTWDKPMKAILLTASGQLDT